MTEKVYEVLKRASLFLQQHHREEKVAEILLQHHLGVSRAQFFAMMRDEAAPEVVAAFEEDVKRHAETGIPVQHLLGYEYFYGRKFTVNPDVLIPRPETEELVEQVIAIARSKNGPLTIVDVGTGSGAIAVTLALELEQATVIATDISEAALHVAKENAARLESNVCFIQGDFLRPLIAKKIRADIIVSNPPYIAPEEADELSDTVRQFDPSLALFAEENGLAAYRKIIRDLPAVVQADGAIAFEIGHTQGEAVKAMLEHTFPRAQTEIKQDINGKDRIVLARLKED